MQRLGEGFRGFLGLKRRINFCIGIPKCICIGRGSEDDPLKELESDATWLGDVEKTNTYLDTGDLAHRHLSRPLNTPGLLRQRRCDWYEPSDCSMGRGGVIVSAPI